jgi:hypothetical protein
VQVALTTFQTVGGKAREQGFRWTACRKS